LSTLQTEQILDTMPLGLVVIDTEKIILRYNEAAARIMGLRVDEALGRNIDEVFRPRQEDRLLQLTVEQAIEFVDYEVQIELADGPITALVNTRRILDEEQRTIGATMVFSDITTVKEMEHSLVRSARLVTIGEMAAGAAHEIRNPLTVIKGFLQLWGAKQTHPYLPLVMEEIEQIDAIVHQFLQWSKNTPIEADGRVTFDLLKSLTALETLCRAEAILKGVDLQLWVDGDQFAVRMNPTEWKQIVANLIRNAFDAFQPHQPTKRVTVHVRKRRQHVTVFIVDDGIGMSRTVLRQVREAFYTTKPNGTGLGLAICEHLAARNGCRFALFSEEGVGTTVVLQVPLDASVQAVGNEQTEIRDWVGV